MSCHVVWLPAQVPALLGCLLGLRLLDAGAALHGARNVRDAMPRTAGLCTVELRTQKQSKKPVR